MHSCLTVILLAMLDACSLPGLVSITFCQPFHNLNVFALHLRTLDKGMLSSLTAFC